MSLAIVVEYSVQNDHSEIYRNQKKHTSQVNYPNMFIMPKKYANVNEVKIAEVIRAIPLQALGQGVQMNPNIGKKDSTSAIYNNLHFRFESFVINPKTQRRVPVFKDIVCNDGNLKELESIPCPVLKNQIKVKILKMPNEVAVQRKLPKISQVQYT